MTPRIAAILLNQARSIVHTDDEKVRAAVEVVVDTLTRRFATAYQEEFDGYFNNQQFLHSSGMDPGKIK